MSGTLTLQGSAARWWRWLVVVAVAAVLSLGGCRPDRTISPSQDVAAGWVQFRIGNFGLAVAEFDRALRSAPAASSLRQQALFGLATTWWLRRPEENPKLAESLYREAIAVVPTNDLTAWSWLALARMKALPVAGEAPDFAQAEDAYQEVVKRFAFHSAGEEAFLCQQAVRLEQGDSERTYAARDALEQFIQTHPRSPWRSAAYGLLAHCFAVLGEGDKRLDALFLAWKTTKIDLLQSVQNLAETYWTIATVAEFETGDFSVAREYYRKLIAEYPSEQRVLLARQELARMDKLETDIRSELEREGGRKGDEK